MIVTHGKFQSAAKPIFKIITQNTIKEKNQILFKVFMIIILNKYNNISL
jgi:hypothetical protein